MKLYFGDVAAFNAEFGRNFAGNGGRAARVFKDVDANGNRIDGGGGIIGGGAYMNIDVGGGAQVEVAGMGQEFFHAGLGLIGEPEENQSSTSSILGYNMTDKAALMMPYNGNLPIEQ